MSRQMERRVGLWLIGARGAISTCVAYGLAGLSEGRIAATGLCTEADPVQRLPLIPVDSIVLGGHDVCTRSLTDSAAELLRSGILKADLVEGASRHAAAFEARIKPGLLDQPDVGLANLDPESARFGALSPREQIERIREDLLTFASENELSRVIVCNVASTEAWREDRAEWESLEALDRALDEGRAQPSSILYAYASFTAGCPHVNFTPSRANSIPAMLELAQREGIPHCGSDGKTGETLLKTVLAPMFTARALRVLSWQGYNMLGNRDGEVLADEAHRASKLHNKDEALRSILGDPASHSHVAIDYVPSLEDWKTAWDFIHFEGFLGARMSLQFTWAGSDSSLAAPLVIDLARLTDFAAEVGEKGVMEHTAAFFKAPLQGGTHDFHAQYAQLIEYVSGHCSKAK